MLLSDVSDLSDKSDKNERYCLLCLSGNENTRNNPFYARQVRGGLHLFKTVILHERSNSLKLPVANLHRKHASRL